MFETMGFANRKWFEDPVNAGIYVCPLIDEETSKKLDITYIGIIFSRPTNLHHFETTHEYFLFLTSGNIIQENDPDYLPKPVSPSDAMYFPPEIKRQLLPMGNNNLEAILLTKPRYNPDDETEDIPYELTKEDIEVIKKAEITGLIPRTNIPFSFD